MLPHIQINEYNLLGICLFYRLHTLYMDLHDFSHVMALDEEGLMSFFPDHGLLR